MITGTSTIRRATCDDIHLVQEAMASMPFDVQGASLSEIAEELSSGTLPVFVLETGTNTTLVAVQVTPDRTYAQFGGLYRVGDGRGLIPDCQTLLAHILPLLASEGVRNIGLMVQLRNKRHEGLMKLYNKLGFRSSAIVMTAGIGGVPSEVL